MKKVLNFQPATTTFFGTFRILTSYSICSMILIFLMSTNLSAQSNQDRTYLEELVETTVYPSHPVNSATPGNHPESQRIYVPMVSLYVIEIVTIDGINFAKLEQMPREEIAAPLGVSNP